MVADKTYAGRLSVHGWRCGAVGLFGWTARFEGIVAGGGFEMAENAVDDVALRDDRHDAHFAAASRAGKRVDFQYLPQQPGPAGPARLQPWRVLLPGLLLPRPGVLLALLARYSGSVRIGAVATREVLPWRRYLCGESVNQLDGVEASGGLASCGVGRCAQDDLSLGVSRDSVDTDGWAREVAAQPFQSVALLGHDELPGEHGKADGHQLMSL